MRYWGLLLTAVLLLGGCARFDDRLANEFTPAPEPGMIEGGPPAPRSDMPEFSPPTDSPEPEEDPDTGPCVDPDPAVVATCLEPTAAVTGVGTEALLVESTGRVLVVAPEEDPIEYGHIDAREGNVSAIAPSPDFEQDHIVYALVTGNGPSRVEKLARGQTSNTVAELAPANGGGLVFDGDVLTVGLGSEVLHFPDFRGIGSAGEPAVVASNMDDIRSLCVGPDGLYITATTERGVVVRTTETVLWTWPDQREAGSCVATDDALGVALPAAARVDVLPLARGVPKGEPTALAEDTYGRLTGLTVVADGVIMSTTTNKDGGEPVSTDDRAIILPFSGATADSRM